jgi:iron complex transport system ATP-binding protein
MRALLELENVTVLRSGRRALDRVSLRVGAREHVAILGPNGSGKSSLVKLLDRELWPVAVEGPYRVRILGSDAWRLQDLRSRIGIVSPDLQTEFAREMTGYEAVLSGFFGSVGVWDHHRITEAMRRRAMEALRRVEASHLADRPMTEMSAGEGRRVLIARALLHRPKALLLDEPTTSLDYRARHEFRGTLRRLARSTTILLVTHDFEDLIPEIRRVVLLKDGRIFKDGPAREVLTGPSLSALYGLPVRSK